MSMQSRICQQCGTPLAPNEGFCGNCGARYAGPSAIDPTQRASAYPGASSPSQIEPTQYAGPPVPPSPYASSPYGTPSTMYGATDPYASPPPSASYTPPPAASYAQPNVGYPPTPNMPYGGAPSPYGQPQAGQFSGGFPQAQAPQPKKGPNVGLILGVVILLIVIIGAGVYFVTRPKGGTTTTTPGVVTTPTVQPIPSPQPLFSDNFADNSKGWATGNGNGFSQTINGGTLTMVETNQNHFLPEFLPNNATYGDFTVTVTFTFQQGDQNDTVGIYMRGDSNLNHDYRVDINGDNSYAIAREYIDSSNVARQHFIVTATPSSAIQPIGQQNKVTVIMKGPQLVLLINGMMISSINDTNYTNGQIALFILHGTTSSGVTAAFSSVAVYPAPAQLPS